MGRPPAGRKTDNCRSAPSSGVYIGRPAVNFRLSSPGCFLINILILNNINFHRHWQASCRGTEQSGDNAISSSASRSFRFGNQEGGWSRFRISGNDLQLMPRHGQHPSGAFGWRHADRSAVVANCKRFITFGAVKKAS
jgi:hypothetical protein